METAENGLPVPDDRDSQEPPRRGPVLPRRILGHECPLDEVRDLLLAQTIPAA